MYMDVVVYQTSFFTAVLIPDVAGKMGKEQQCVLIPENEDSGLYAGLKASLHAGSFWSLFCISLGFELVLTWG